jgi:microsomal epoxide hydrolase
MHAPRLWVKQKYHNLRSYSPMARGGHFAAMEEPGLMAEDLLAFISMTEKKK